MSILVTGGLGYIGSHTSVELLNSGHEIIVVDDLSNSNKSVLDKIKKITNKEIKFYEISILQKEKLDMIFRDNKIDAVIHFAGFKAVFDSLKRPLDYYQNNIVGTLTLLETMNTYDVKNFVFSSSATVYGNPKHFPIKEDSELSTTNPYGYSKLVIENALNDLYKSDHNWSISILRYFNPIGAHSSSLIGEKPNGIPSNLLPYITKVANGELEQLHVFGNDYDTNDGTAIRDFIHVVDLAKGHIKALERNFSHTGCDVFNLGTGKGYSVLEIIETFQKANNINIPYVFDERRDGDIPISYADVEKSLELLNWKAEKGIVDMCVDAWNWERNN